MNEKVCRLCRRYAGRLDSAAVRGWMCAKLIHESHSEVIPGFSYYERDMLHPMTESRKEPPEWCERPLEQVILDKDADVEARPDTTLVHDGNEAAERHQEERTYKWR